MVADGAPAVIASRCYRTQADSARCRRRRCVLQAGRKGACTLRLPRRLALLLMRSLVLHLWREQCRPGGQGRVRQADPEGHGEELRGGYGCVLEDPERTLCY